DNRCEDVAFGVDAAFCDHDARAVKMTAVGRTRDGLEALIVAQLVARHDKVDLAQRAGHPIRAYGIFDDASIALESDRGDAVVDLETLGILVFLRVHDIAVGVDHRLQAEIADTYRHKVTVALDAPPKPVTVIGDTDDFPAGRKKAETGKLAETAILRTQLEPADEFERTETGLSRAQREPRNQGTPEFDRLGCTFLRMARYSARQTQQRGNERRLKTPHRPRRATRRASRWFSSPNSAASC